MVMASDSSESALGVRFFQGGGAMIVHRRGAIEHDRRGDDGVQRFGQPVGSAMPPNVSMVTVNVGMVNMVAMTRRLVMSLLCFAGYRRLVFDDFRVGFSSVVCWWEEL